MGTRRIETQLDEATVRELDGWRTALTPRPSRSEAVRLLLEERLCAKPAEPGLCPGADRLGALYALERVSGFGPVKFRAMHQAGVEAQAGIENPDVLPFAGRTGEKLRRAIASLSDADLAAAHARAADQVERARALGIHPRPRRPGLSGARVRQQQPRPGALRARRPGDLGRQRSRGRRGLPEHARTLRERRPDLRHGGGEDGRGRGVGLRNRRRLDWTPRRAGGRRPHRVRHALRPGQGVPAGESRPVERTAPCPGAVFVSEFGFGQRAASLLLRKRNKLIAAFAQGVLVAQSAVDGGAMNAYASAWSKESPWPRSGPTAPGKHPATR